MALGRRDGPGAIPQGYPQGRAARLPLMVALWAGKGRDGNKGRAYAPLRPQILFLFYSYFSHFTPSFIILILLVKFNPQVCPFDTY